MIEQYELRELHFHSAMRAKEIEVQWNMARYEQQKKAVETEGNRARQLNNQVLTFTKTETELRNQLNVYVEKFKQVCTLSLSLARPTQALTSDEVEDTLNNSNDLFLTFRKEMEDMSKKTKKLEKDNEAYRRKDTALNQSILKMAEERNKNLRTSRIPGKRMSSSPASLTKCNNKAAVYRQGCKGPWTVVTLRVEMLTMES